MLKDLVGKSVNLSRFTLVDLGLTWLCCENSLRINNQKSN